MLTFAGRVFLVAGPTEMRKSFNGLAGLVREKLHADPMSRHLFLFCNRARNRLKILVSVESGMWVLANPLIECCRLANVDMVSYLADVLVRVATHPARRVADLLPANWIPAPQTPQTVEFAIA